MFEILNSEVTDEAKAKYGQPKLSWASGSKYEKREQWLA